MHVRIWLKNRILYYIDKKNITANELARLSGLSYSTIKGILDGNIKKTRLTTVIMLCDGLDITLTEFFDCDEFRNLEQEIK